MVRDEVDRNFSQRAFFSGKVIFWQSHARFGPNLQPLHCLPQRACTRARHPAPQEAALTLERSHSLELPTQNKNARPPTGARASNVRLRLLTVAGGRRARSVRGGCRRFIMRARAKERGASQQRQGCDGFHAPNKSRMSGTLGVRIFAPAICVSLRAARPEERRQPWVWNATIRTLL